MEASRFRPTDALVPYEELKASICWDDDEDQDAALATGVYVTCGGIWKREQDNEWRFWEDGTVADELNFNNG